MSKNFKVRLSVALMLLALATVLIFTFDSLPFKIFWVFFSSVAAIELLSFFKRKISVINIIMALIELTLIVCSNIFIWRQNWTGMFLLIFSVCSYDSFAYIYGKLIGGTIFKKARPFPHISKNKTWGGTIVGLLYSFTFTGIMLLITNSYEYSFYLGGIFAMSGDLLESLLKRCFNVKDSNEIIIKNNFFSKLELLIGGKEGHGGYLDRIDSALFTTTALLVISLII